MKASVIHKHGGLENIVYTEDFPDPVPDLGEIVVRVAACGVNYHDIFSRRGMPGIKLKFPLITGSDIAGEIVEISGETASGRWKRGDRVLVNPFFMYDGKSGMTGETTLGGRAEYVKVHVSQLIRLPNAVSYDDAAALPLAYGTAHRMLNARGQVRPGEKVLILGASGGVGVACVQLAKLIGAEIAVCSSSAEKLQTLKKLGADHLIDYATSDMRHRLYEIWGKPRIDDGGGADVVVNFTGGDTWIESLKCVTRSGRLLTCGATAGFDAQTDIRYIWSFEQTIVGSNGWTLADLESLLDLIQKGNLKPFISETFPLRDSNLAETRMEGRNVTGKILIKP